MDKKNSKKRILLAVSLIALILVGAIVSIVLVFAFESHDIETNISIDYNLNGVGVSIESTYAMIPLDESKNIERIAMTADDGSSKLEFGVSEKEITASMNPEQVLSLNNYQQQIVFEYIFENIADAAFSLNLYTSPFWNKEYTYNMVETYLVSATRLNVEDYRDKIIDTELQPQNMSEYGQKVYIYVSAKVDDMRRNARYAGEFVWDLTNKKTIEINLNERGETRKLNVIPTTQQPGIAMPVIKPEISLNEMFLGYNTAADGSGTTYIDFDGTTPNGITADIAAGSTLYAQIVDAFVLDGTTITNLTSSAQTESILYIPSGVTAIGNGTNAITTNATKVYVPSTVTTIAANAFSGNTTIEFVDYETAVQTTSYADGSEITSIGDNAFKDCSALKEITIPKTVTSIGARAFDNTVSVEKINYYLEDDLFDISYTPFENCGTSGNGIYVWFGAKVKKVPDNLFYPYDESRVPNIKHVNFATGAKCEEIGTRAFSLCSEVEYFKIPKSVTTLKSGAVPVLKTLAGIKCIIELEDLKSWLSVSDWSHGNHPNYWDSSSDLWLNGQPITELVIPEGVTEIYEWSFSAFELIESVVIPNSVTTIHEEAFSYCSALTYVKIPSSVTSISSSAFKHPDIYLEKEVMIFDLEAINTWLNISWGENHPSYYNDCQVMLQLNGELITDLVIPEGVVEIKPCAFFDMHTIKSVTLPSSLSDINESAFNGCVNINTITIQKISLLANIGDYAFAYCTALTDVYFGGTQFLFDTISITSGNELFTNATLHCTYDGPIASPAEYFTISEDGTTVLGLSDEAKAMENLELVIGGGDITTIGESAFKNCENIISVVIFNGVTVIEDNAFSCCYVLTSMDIQSRVTSIGERAFSECYELTSINIPNTVTSIGYNAFLQCSNLTSVTFENNSQLTSLSINVFRYCSSLTTITIPSSVTSIGGYAFEGCNNLTTITIPSSVTSIGISAFYGCFNLVQIKNLSGIDLSTKGYKKPAFAEPEVTTLEGEFVGRTEIGSKYAIYTIGNEKILLYATDNELKEINDLANGITQINEHAFSTCRSLTRIIIPSSVTKIGNYAFLNNISLTSIAFENNSQLISIEDSAFRGCISLTSIIIPSSVTSIGNYVFSGCHQLKSVTFGNTNGWQIYDSALSTATGYEINVSTPATNATNLKNTTSGSISATATNWGILYLRRDA